ncbi:hypothetical protein FNV43_RR19064 [Rhamnella rubrinervis]|uniref:Ubiquitin-like protease family profile domain-containing protein n=1 Tax=Rhamnella rubrinervis TaxID=2594499 RepID=A0A8K0E6C1_9ROSA|nr:hypothetical protein FNV43_RR19064 [Rhamnella rubrinervis]
MNEDVMEFNFNGNGAIFTRKEFGIITGLKMENTLDVPSPPYSDRIKNRYFGHIHKIKNMDVRNVFINVRRNQLEYEDDFMRLALIYFLECGLLGKESQVRINLDYLSMVEDLNFFNQYSWGLVSYNATLRSLQKALDLHRGELNKSSTYSLGGFPLAFQHDELKSYMEALNIKVDNVANDLYDFRLDSMRKIDCVANDLGSFRLESMREFQSIHNTMREMFDYIKHRQLNLTGSLLPPADFNPKRAPPDELEMKLLTYMTSSDDVTLDYNVCDINKQFFQEMIEGELLNDKVLMPLNIEDRHWVLANIDLVKRQIYLYDSTLSKSTYRDQFKPLWIMLSYILKQANFFTERSNIKSTMIQFSHSYVENFPKQRSRAQYSLAEAKQEVQKLRLTDHPLQILNACGSDNLFTDHLLNNPQSACGSVSLSGTFLPANV